MRVRAIVLTLGMLAILWPAMSLRAQSGAATRPSTHPAALPPPAPAAPPSALPQNLDRALDDLITMDADAVAISDIINSLRNRTNTNIVVNWNALAQSGIERATPVTLHVKDLPYEQLVKTLTEVLTPKTSTAGTMPAAATTPEGGAALAEPQLGLGLRLNYSIGDNTLFFTNNADLGKTAVLKPYPVTRPLAMALDGEAAGADRAGQLEALFRAALLRMDEPLNAKRRAGADIGTAPLAIKTGTLAATVSARGHLAIAKILASLATPVKPGQQVVGIILTGSAKRTQDALAGKIAGWKGGAIPPATAEAMARDPKKIAGLNVALLTTTADELAKPTPALSGTITDGGVILIGPTDALRARTLFCAYDLRDAIKRQQAKTKPPIAAADAQAALVAAAKAKVIPLAGTWSDDLASSAPALMVPYHGLLLVFTTADTHRQLTAALQEVGR